MNIITSNTVIETIASPVTDASKFARPAEHRRTGLSASVLPVVQAASELHELGFNVLPIPRVGMQHNNKKPPYGPYSCLFITRLPYDYLPFLFEGANLAVICGKLSRNLFVIDCDTHRTFQWVRQELQSRKIAPWIVSSNRGGHYWLLSTDGEVQNSRPLPDIQIIGQNQYIVAPPSLHPKGEIVYHWVQRPGKLPPVVSLDLLDFLPSLELLPARRTALPQVANKVLVEQDPGDYSSNSEAEFAAAMSLAKAGCSEPEIIAAFEHHQPPHFRSKKDGAEWMKRYLLPRAFEYAQTDPDPDRYEKWARARPWPGRTGTTDKWVFLALCHRLRLERRPAFRATVREIAELAQVNTKTVSKSLKRLQCSGVIKWAGKNPQGSFLWSFTRMSNAT